MRRSPLRLLLTVVLGLIVVIVAGAAAVDLYTDALWFGGLGFRSVFWTRLGYDVAIRFATGVIGAAVVLVNLWFALRHIGPVRLRRRYGNIEIAEQIPKRHLVIGVIVTAILAGWWLSALQFGDGRALGLVTWLRRVPWGETDPLFRRDLSWYVFALPAYFQIVDFLLIAAIWSAALALLGYVLVGSVQWTDGRPRMDRHARLHLAAIAAGVVLLLGARYWLGRYGLLLEGGGIGAGLGYTDVHARLPAHRILTLLAVVTAGALVWGAWRESWVPPAVAAGAFVVAVIAAGRLYPAFVQRFRVEPNELAREAPYIRWNIDFTRRAYGLDRIDDRAYPYRPGRTISWDRVGPRLERLPLWDAAPLRAAFNQVQTIFGYYNFVSVDFDRYATEDGPVQVAIAAREFHPTGLPPAAQTWQTLHLNPQYLRGNGAVVSPSARTASAGEPVLWVENIDPIVRAPAAPPTLDVRNPALYVGEDMGDYALLIPGRDSSFLGTAGVDFPRGVRVGSLGRRLAFAWRFGDKNLLFSSEVTNDSRVTMRRSLSTRLDAIAPFVIWDPDPYPVIAEGRVVWIVDGYTAAAAFPLARPVTVQGVGRVRYLRNSVKATVDAASGRVTLYAIDARDPLLATYRGIFPGLVEPIDAMPDRLRRHLRYPALYLRLQADILEQYHLDRAEAFYAGQDVWALPRTSDSGTYDPVYALHPLPGEDRPEFLLTMPFIARERQNMTALLIARSDPPNYGEVILYELPRDQQIPGPSQIESIMEQNPEISAQLSLWRQAGSDVDLGRLRVVPIDSTLLYVEPLFLSAQQSAIPELARVIVSDGGSVAMAGTLDAAIDALRGASVDDGAAGGPSAARPAPEARLPADWSRGALELMREAEARLRAGDWAGFGEAWAQLRALLERAEPVP